MADNTFGSLAPDDWQVGVEQANKYGQLSPSSPPDQTSALLMAAMARAGMTLQKNAPLLAETAPGRMIQGISRVATGGTPYAGPGLRREDYTDDPEARHPVEPMIHDAMNAADVMSMGGMPMAKAGAFGVMGGKLIQPEGISAIAQKLNGLKSQRDAFDVHIATLPGSLNGNDLRAVVEAVVGYSPVEKTKSGLIDALKRNQRQWELNEDRARAQDKIRP